LVGSCGLYGLGLGKRGEEKQILFKKKGNAAPKALV
tara:strand:- start:410 stop:517 length:108 start_codon:yes stop_codon:yes gene_type:complete